MKAVCTLPEGYREIDSMDLQKDKKTALKVNLLAILIAACLAVPMHFFCADFDGFRDERRIVGV